jgi:hypothetical protein
MPAAFTVHKLPIRVDLYQILNTMLHSQIILANTVGIFIFAYTKAWLARDLKQDARLQNTIFFLTLYSPARAMAFSFTMFRDHTQRRATVGRIPLDE